MIASGARGILLLCAGLAIGSLCLASRDARCDPVPVGISVEYQHVEEQGTIRDVWSRAVDAGYYTHLSPSLQLSSQLRLNELSYVGHPDRTISPYGDLRLFSTTFGLISSYRPTSTTNASGATLRQREGQVSGFLARPGLPRLDVLWTRRTQDAVSSTPGVTSTTRNGHLAWQLGHFELRGSAGDVQQSAGDQPVGTVHEKTWDSGLAYRVARARWNVSAEGTLSDTRRRTDAGSTSGTRATAADFSFHRTLSRVLDCTSTYQFRGVDAGDGVRQRLSTHEAATLVNYRPTRTAQVLFGAGLRPLAGPGNSSRSLGYGVVTASVQGRVRAGWTGLASASQSLDRQPTGTWYGITSLRGASKWLLARGLKADLDASVSTSSDTTARQTRASMQSQLGITANPLRPWFIVASLRGYRAGPDLGTPLAHSFSRSVDVRWQPSGRFDAAANFAESGALPRGTPRLRTHAYTVHVKPTERLQMDVQQSASNSRRVSAASSYLVGSEAWSGHLLIGFGRRWFVRAGGSIVDPGKPTRSREVDATIAAKL